MSKMPGVQRGWKILLLIHVICYEAFFIYAIDSFKFGAYYPQQYLVILMVWSLILMLHVGVTYYQNGRGDISRLEREAYRDGFADAVRQLGHRNDTAERLMLDDEGDGELVEFHEKRKRSGER
jgi:hypothetical protein